MVRRQASTFVALLEERLRARLDREGSEIAIRWAPCSADRFTLVSREYQVPSAQEWTVNLAAGTVDSAVVTAPAPGPDIDDRSPDGEYDDGPKWSVVGNSEAWAAVLRGEVNLSVALRQYSLRYCDFGEWSGPTLRPADVRIDMLADLLGLTSWDGSAAGPEVAVPVGRSDSL